MTRPPARTAAVVRAGRGGHRDSLRAAAPGGGKPRQIVRQPSSPSSAPRHIAHLRHGSRVRYGGIRAASRSRSSTAPNRSVLALLSRATRRPQPIDLRPDSVAPGRGQVVPRLPEQLDRVVNLEQVLRLLARLPVVVDRQVLGDEDPRGAAGFLRPRSMVRPVGKRRRIGSPPIGGKAGAEPGPAGMFAFSPRRLAHSAAHAPPCPTPREGRPVLASPGIRGDGGRHNFRKGRWRV